MKLKVREKISARNNAGESRWNECMRYGKEAGMHILQVKEERIENECRKVRKTKTSDNRNRYKNPALHCRECGLHEETAARLQITTGQSTDGTWPANQSSGHTRSLRRNAHVRCLLTAVIYLPSSVSCGGHISD